MGIVDPFVADDVNDYATGLLRREDPDPLELFHMMMLGRATREDEPPAVYVDGVRR